MRINATTSLNDAMSRIAEGNTGAGSVLALILKDRPESALRFMREMDRIGAYGNDVWWLYCECGQELRNLLKELSDGTAEARMAELKRVRGQK